MSSCAIIVLGITVSYILVTEGQLFGEKCFAISYPNCTMQAFTVVPTFDPRGDNSTSLLLYDNIIARIQKEAFVTAGEHIEEIDISHNLITEIDTEAFARVDTTLIRLVLSHNRFSMLLPYYFTSLTKLVELDLSSNLLTSIDNAFVGLPSLNRLKLDDNNLHQMTEYVIRESEDCATCMSSQLSPWLLISLDSNLIRYVPSCAIDKMRWANPSSMISISIFDNYLYCDCADASWIDKLPKFNLSEDINTQYIALTVCAITSFPGVSLVPIQTLLQKESGLCNEGHQLSPKECSSLQLELTGLPSSMRPTLRFGVSEHAESIAQYDITIAASDGAQLMTTVIPSGRNEFIVEETLRPNSDYTVCVAAESNDESIYFGKICKGYYTDTAPIAAATLDEGQPTVFAQLAVGSVALVLLSIGAVVQYVRSKTAPVRVPASRALSTALIRQDADYAMRIEQRASRMTAFAASPLYRSPSGFYENDSQEKIDWLHNYRGIMELSDSEHSEEDNLLDAEKNLPKQIEDSKEDLPSDGEKDPQVDIPTDDSNKQENSINIDVDDAQRLQQDDEKQQDETINQSEGADEKLEEVPKSSAEAKKPADPLMKEKNEAAEFFWSRNWDRD